MMTFDPYHTWLGIPPEEQPPDHYRLLSIRPFESSDDVIEHAADRQMTYIRTLQTGQHRDASQRMLNEISAARAVLLNAERKAAYDQQLRREAAAGRRVVESATSVPPPPVPGRQSAGAALLAPPPALGAVPSAAPAPPMPPAATGAVPVTAPRPAATPTGGPPAPPHSPAMGTTQSSHAKAPTPPRRRSPHARKPGNSTALIAGGATVLLLVCLLAAFALFSGGRPEVENDDQRRLTANENPTPPPTTEASTASSTRRTVDRTGDDVKTPAAGRSDTTIAQQDDVASVKEEGPVETKPDVAGQATEEPELSAEEIAEGLKLLKTSGSTTSGSASSSTSGSNLPRTTAGASTASAGRRSTASQGSQAAKHALPDSAADKQLLKKKRDALQEIFSQPKLDFRARQRNTTSLISSAGAEQDPITQYAMLQQAYNQAVALGDWAVAKKALDERIARFDTDPLALKLDLARDFVAKAKTDRDKMVIGSYVVGLFDSAMDEGRLAEARAIQLMVTAMGRETHDVKLQSHGTDFQRRINEYREVERQFDE